MDRRSIRTYTELSRLKTFDERFDYLRLNGSVGIDTFGYDRIFNQKFYQSAEWRRIRNHIIVRDKACDLGYFDNPIPNRVVIHHMNPIDLDDIIDSTEYLLNPEYLICCSNETHNALHYGRPNERPTHILVERTPNDTCPWKK